MIPDDTSPKECCHTGVLMVREAWCSFKVVSGVIKFLKGHEGSSDVHFNCAGQRPLFRRATFSDAFFELFFSFSVARVGHAGHFEVWKHRFA